MSTIVKLGCLSALQVLGLSLAASVFWSCLPMVIYVGSYVPTGLSVKVLTFCHFVNKVKYHPGSLDEW